MTFFALSAVLLAVVTAAQAPDVLSEAELSAGDECPRTGSGGEDAGCALSALQRHARGKLQAQEPAKEWEQCGGNYTDQVWTGPTTCIAGYTCVQKDKYYSQCKPEVKPAPASLIASPDDEEEPAEDDYAEDFIDDEDNEDEEDDEEPADDDGEEPPPPASSEEEQTPSSGSAAEPPAGGDDAQPPAGGDDAPPPSSGDDQDDSGKKADEPEDDGPHQEPLTPNPPTPEPPMHASLPPIIIKGNFLYDSATGKRFFSKGVAYNPRNIKYDLRWGKSPNCTPGEPVGGELGYAADVIDDELESQWGPALKAIANLGANTVRIYNLDPEKSHEKFMTRAAELGLYVIIPLTRKDWGYLPAFPAPDCYTKDIDSYGNVGVNLLTTGKLIVKEFSKYNNTLLFTIANEMTVNDKNGFSAFPCVKAYTRDIHRYQSSCKEHMRRVPLIYADMDIGQDRTMVGEYMSCEVESPDDAVDAYGINVYSWCDKGYPDEHGVDSFQYSPYLDIKTGFVNFQKPVLFTEFGCNVGEWETFCPYKGGRQWPDVKVIMGTMGEIISGAVAFEFSMENNEYGLALTPGFLEGQNEIYLLDNYFALQKQFHAHNVSDKWDAEEPTTAMADCKWTPESVSALSTTHSRARCPSQDKADDLMRRRGVDKVVSWEKLPPSPEAPLYNVHGQTECPADSVTPAAYEEGCCHMKCPA